MIVDIDEAQLDAEFDADLARLPPDGLEGEYLPADQSPAEWAKILRKFGVAEKIHRRALPAWEIEEDEKEAVTDATAEILNQWWPGGISNIDNWSPWAKLGFVILGILAANFDDEALRFKPTHPPEQSQQKPEEEPHAS